MAFTRQIIFFILLAITAKAWAADTTIPLVYIYCDYLTSSAPTLEDNEKNWPELVRHFERRELLNKKAVISESPKFQECVRKNSQLFETGEILFEGKSQLQSSLGVLKETKPQGPTLIDSDFTVEDKSITGQYFSVILEPKDGTWSPAEMESEMKAREARYSNLWKNFLDAVRDNLSTKNP